MLLSLLDMALRFREILWHAFVQGLHSLRCLALHDVYDVRNVEGLAPLTQLESVSIRDSRLLHDIAGVRHLVRLKHLDVTGSAVTGASMTATAKRLDTAALT
jgi:hypothetical protein